MTNGSLAETYLLKATGRMKVLVLLFAEEDWSDVVRKAQESAEFALKGVLRQVRIEPPHWHEVGSILREHRNRLSPPMSRPTWKAWPESPPFCARTASCRSTATSTSS